MPSTTLRIEIGRFIWPDVKFQLDRAVAHKVLDAYVVQTGWFMHTVELIGVTQPVIDYLHKVESAVTEQS